MALAQNEKDVIDTQSIRFRYQTFEIGTFDIHLRTLRDRQQFSDKNKVAENLGVSPASWSLFGVVWDSSQVLAHLMLDMDIQGKRILEVGCGIALPSLILNKREANITATDYHPNTQNFLEQNTSLNNDRKIPFVRTSWLDINDDLGKFDVIIGSDLLYEPDHVDQLSSFIDRHSMPNNEIIIVDPGRSLYTRFSRKMKKLGYSYQKDRSEFSEYLNKPFKGTVLSYTR
jgi:predicted nicotinamide N-methyase